MIPAVGLAAREIVFKGVTRSRPTRRELLIAPHAAGPVAKVFIEYLAEIYQQPAAFADIADFPIRQLALIEPPANDNCMAAFALPWFLFAHGHSTSILQVADVKVDHSVDCHQPLVIRVFGRHAPDRQVKFFG